MNNEQMYTDPDTGEEVRVTGSPIYEVGDFIHTLLAIAAVEHVGYDEEDGEARDKAHDAAWDLKLTKRALAHLCAEAVDDMGRLDCLWCGVDTVDEYYIVTREIWEQYGPKKNEGCLCIGCLEDRMDRRLVPGDFTDVPVNTDGGHRSERLRDRMGLS